MDVYEDFLLCKQLAGVSKATLSNYDYSIRRLLEAANSSFSPSFFLA